MENDSVHPCRKCLLLQSGREDVLKEIAERIGKIPDGQKTPKEAYAARLSACSECEHLLSGTCLKCGCYPEFRAAFAKNRCPAKKW